MAYHVGLGQAAYDASMKSVGKMCNPHPRWKTRVGIL